MIKNPIFQSIGQWFDRTFADPEVVSLFFTLVISIILFECFGKILMPVLVSVIVAYLLNSLVKFLVRYGCPKVFAVWIVYIIFLGLFIYGILYLIPLIGRQLVNLIDQMPGIFALGQLWLTKLMLQHPWAFADFNLDHILVYFKEQSPQLGQKILHFSWTLVPNMAELVLYLVLVPLLVFFFLKDGHTISQWLRRFLPRRHILVKQVSMEVYNKIGAYVKGRVIEVLIVAVIASILFELLGLQYAILLGVLLGLSVIVPYIGAVIAVIPIICVGLTQWGLSAHFWYLMLVFVIMVSVDGNILFPLLFSHTMDLHPVVIILSVLVFGKLWGFWGIFFAIPLATLVNAVLRVWPRNEDIIGS